MAREAGQPPARTRLTAAERRETILRAATEVFATAGYRAARVCDVAARVGVSEPVIFQNFGSKAALFAAVIERSAARVRASLDSAAAESGSAAQLLAHVLAVAGHRRPGQSAAGHGSMHAGAEHEATAYGVLFTDAIDLTAEPELTEQARRAIRAVAAHLADLVRRAQAEGGADPDLDPEAGAWLLLSVLSARRFRAEAMPAGIEPGVAALALRALDMRAGAGPATS